MNIKLATHKDINKLLKLKVNKGFKDNFTLFIPDLMEREITFIAIEKNEILGAMSYSSSLPIGKTQIEGKEYILEKEMKFLEFIEVKPTERNKGIGKVLAKHMFEICAATDCGIRISNIVLEGMNLVNTYRDLSQQHKVDLFFYHGNHLKPQVFNAVPIKIQNQNIFKKLFV